MMTQNLSCIKFAENPSIRLKNQSSLVFRAEQWSGKNTNVQVFTEYYTVYKRDRYCSENNIVQSTGVFSSGAHIHNVLLCYK